MQWKVRKENWILPEEHLEIGFNIYQPTSLSGRLIKKVLPIIYRVPLVRWLVDKTLKIKHCDLDIPETIQTKIKDHDNKIL